MVLRVVLGAIYTAMALGQLASLDRMPDILAAYGLVDGAAAGVLAGGLIGGELLCGLWFLARPRSTALTPVGAYAAVSLTWSALAVQGFARGLVVDNCGCFGAYLTQTLNWSILVQDGLTLLYAALLFRAARAPRTSEARTRPGNQAGEQPGDNERKVAVE